MGYLPNAALPGRGRRSRSLGLHDLRHLPLRRERLVKQAGKKGLFFRGKKRTFLFIHTCKSLHLSHNLGDVFLHMESRCFRDACDAGFSEAAASGPSVGAREKKEQRRRSISRSKKKYLFPGLDYILFTVIIRENFKSRFKSLIRASHRDASICASEKKFFISN